MLPNLNYYYENVSIPQEQYEWIKDLYRMDKEMNDVPFGLKEYSEFFLVYHNEAIGKTRLCLSKIVFDYDKYTISPNTPYEHTNTAKLNDHLEMLGRIIELTGYKGSITYKTKELN